MNKKTMYLIIISICCLITLVMIVVLKNVTRNYPSVVDDKCVETSGVDFMAEYRTIGHAKNLVCTLVNHNDYDINYGQEYYLEKEKEGKWYEVIDTSGKRTDEKAWNAIGYTLATNEQKEMNISLESFKDLKAGNYRVVKFVSTKQVTKYRNIIVAYFQVTDK